MDWTKLTNNFHALVAAVPRCGHALPIYFELHPDSMQNNSDVEEKFLRRLSTIIPVGSKPIIVTDAGFRGPFFRAVLTLGWDFVGRLRGRVTVQYSDGYIADKAALLKTVERWTPSFGPQMGFAKVVLCSGFFRSGFFSI